MVTTRGFYNLKKKGRYLIFIYTIDIKRKIDLKAIKGITYGTYGSEFVLHVN